MPPNTAPTRILALGLSGRTAPSLFRFSRHPTRPAPAAANWIPPVCGFSSLVAILSGGSRWQVYPTNIPRGDGDAHATAADIAGYVASADSNTLWKTFLRAAPNGVQPWSAIAGISEEARWMWKNVPGDPDPTQGGSGEGGMMIFTMNVSGPGATSLLGLGGIAAFRRRRKDASRNQ